MTDTTDDDYDRLVVAAAAGDSVALHRLLAALRPRIVRYCRARMGSGSTATDDVAQEVLLALLGALPRYRATGAGFLAFVYGIAAHKIADHYRYQQRHPVQPVAEPHEVAEQRPGPEQRALSREVAGRLGVLLGELSPQSREILALRMIAGLSARETAAATGSTPTAV
ncbi:MAG: sigma-70 family RNA polymerase sigma factor, partial [Sciscionella sp.]